MTPNAILLFNRSVPGSAIFREASSYIKLNKYRDPLTDIMQRINVLGTVSHKMDDSAKSLPLGLRLNTVEEEAENSVWANGVGGLQEIRSFKSLWPKHIWTHRDLRQQAQGPGLQQILCVLITACSFVLLQDFRVSLWFWCLLLGSFSSAGFVQLLCDNFFF